MIKSIHHLGIAVKSLEQALGIYSQALGLEVQKTVEVPDFKVKIGFVPVGSVLLEFIEPLSSSGAFVDFLAQRGEGVHHIALQVSDIDSALEKLKNQGIKLLDEKARPGAEGRIAFLNPESTSGVTVELIEVWGEKEKQEKE
jgi:methylmalonyl-CoA/ethylmalonyl-CoA epimerase